MNQNKKCLGEYFKVGTKNYDTDEGELRTYLCDKHVNKYTLYYK